MCGISGVFNGERYGPNLRLDDFLGTACITGVLRGMHSTGMYQVRANKDVEVYKKALCGFDFVQLKRTQALINSADRAVATVIHHRAATHGDVRDENAHPFEHYDDRNYIVGVHNGGVSQYNKKEDGISFNVDSDWLYYKIFKDGPDKALGSLNTTAAYALVWYDQSKNRHYIAANKQRPISWGFVKGKNIMLFASEHAHLYWMASRYGLEFEEEIWTPQEGYIYEFNEDDWRKYKAIKIETKPPVVQALPHRSTGAWDAQSGSWRSEAGTSTVYSDAVLQQEGILKDKKYRFLPNTRKLDKTYSLVYVEGILVQEDDEDQVFDACTDLSNVRVDALQEADYAVAFPSAVRTDKEGKKRIVVGLGRFVTEGVTNHVKGPRGTNITELEFKRLTKDGCVNCSCELTLKHQDTITWVNEGVDPCCAACMDFITSGSRGVN